MFFIHSFAELEASFVVEAHHGGSIRSQKLSRLCIQQKKKLTLKVQFPCNSPVHGDLHKDRVRNAKKSAEVVCAISSLIMGHLRNAGEHTGRKNGSGMLFKDSFNNNNETQT